MRLCELTEGHKPLVDPEYNQGMSMRTYGRVEPVKITTEARVSYYAAYGLTAEQQIALEKSFSCVTVGSHFVDAFNIGAAGI